MKFQTVAALAASFLVASAASAATVVVTPGSGQRSLSISFYDPLGQSFTAGATDVNLQSFGFQLQTLNSGSAASPLTLTFYTGSGFGGASLGSFTLTPSGIPTTRTPTFVDFTTTGILLSPGQTYTAALTSNSNRYGLVYGPDINLNTGAVLGPDAYAGGRLLATGFTDRPCSGGTCDANFRYRAIGAPAVPEPATWAMMIAGFGLVGGAMRRRSTKVRFA